MARCTPMHRKRRRRNRECTRVPACLLLLCLCIHVAVAFVWATPPRPLASLSALIGRAGRSGSIVGRITHPPPLPSPLVSRRLLQTATGAADAGEGTVVAQHDFAQAAFTLLQRSQADAQITQQATVGEFVDTFWTLPGDAVSPAAHWIQLDIDVDPAVLQGEDVLQLWQGTPTLRGGLIKQWTGKLLQAAAIAEENALRASGDASVDSDEVLVGPAPEHLIRGAPHEHVDLWAPSATLRYHRNTTAATAAAAATPLFTARWSLSPRCPEGLEPSEGGGCAEPSRLDNSPWLLVIIVVPGLLFVGFVLCMMAPHSLRACPGACCIKRGCRKDKEAKEARDAETRQSEQDWTDGRHNRKPESLVEMARRHKASMRALALGGGAAAAAKGNAKASNKQPPGSSIDPSPDAAGAVHPGRSPKVRRDADASPSSPHPVPWVVLHGAPEEFLTGAAAARAIRATDGTAADAASAEHSASSAAAAPFNILRGGPEPFLTGHAAAKAIRCTEGTNITREPSPSPPAQQSPHEDEEHRHHCHQSPQRSEHDEDHRSHRDSSPSVGRHSPSAHAYDQHANLVRAQHHVAHHPHGDADKDEAEHSHAHRHRESHHSHCHEHRQHSEHHRSERHRDHAHSEPEADRKEHREPRAHADDKKSHEKDHGDDTKHEHSNSIDSAELDVHGPHAVHQLQQHMIDKKAEADAHDPHLSPKDTAGDDVQHSNTTEHPSEDGFLRSKVDALSGIGPAEHEWCRRLKRELQRTIPVFFFELAGTSVNWVFAVQYINAAADNAGGIIGDQLALAYLSFGALATLGALINAWSRVLVIRELFCEMYAAQHMPLSHSAYNSRNVAPGIEIAFLERHIHHLKVVGLTLLVESLPFAMLGFSKLYRFNAVQSNLLLLVSCGLSAFWVGSKITRLISIPETLSHIHRLEAEEREEAGVRRAAQARRERKERLPGATVGRALAAVVNAVLHIDQDAEERERDAAWEQKEKEAQQRRVHKHQQHQTQARARGKHQSHHHHRAAPSPSPSPSPRHDRSRSRSRSVSRSADASSNGVDVSGDGMVAKRAVAASSSPNEQSASNRRAPSKSSSQSGSRSHSRSAHSASRSPSRSPDPRNSVRFHESPDPVD